MEEQRSWTAPMPANRRSRLNAEDPPSCSFPPIVRSDAELLILGTMPGEESLRRGEYYAHPRNAFWPIMGALFGAGPERPYGERVARLMAARVAVWDVIGRCRRSGSADAAIVPESVIPNNIAGVLRLAPRIHRIAFNGAGAERWFRRCFRQFLSVPPNGLRFIRLPSTSPAFAALSWAEKLEHWRTALIGADGLPLRIVRGPRAP